MSEPDAVVIGAGPCGVATALALKDRGLRPLVLEKDDCVISPDLAVETIILEPSEDRPSPSETGESDAGG